MIVREDASLEEIDDFFSGELRQMGDLGFSFRKAFKKISAPFVKLIKMDPLMSRVYAHQKRVMKKFRKKVLPKLIKAAPWLAIAAEALNFIVPGLGVAVALAITFAASAYKLDQAKKAKAKIKKLTKEEEAKADAEINQAESEADKATMSAYDKGADYFQKSYKITRADFQSRPIDERIRLLHIAIYDQHAPTMIKMGVTRDAFVKMTVDDQADALAKMANSIPAAAAVPGKYVTPVVPPPEPEMPEAPGAVLLTEEDQDFDPDELSAIHWAMIIGGSTLVLGLITYLVIQKRKRREGRA
jgi:phosphate/sulfate permease